MAVLLAEKTLTVMSPTYSVTVAHCARRIGVWALMDAKIAHYLSLASRPPRPSMYKPSP
jgi:hypothetical protein